MGSPRIATGSDQQHPAAVTTSRRHRPAADANLLAPGPIQAADIQPQLQRIRATSSPGSYRPRSG
jgi:hypothetical protein